MKTSIKRLWVKALRSGDYAELPVGYGYTCLARTPLSNEGHTEFSALGVLCDLYTCEENKGEFMTPKVRVPGGLLTYLTDDGDENMFYLAPQILEWAEFEKQDPWVNQHTLLEIQAAGWNFKIVSYMIQEYL